MKYCFTENYFSITNAVTHLSIDEMNSRSIEEWTKHRESVVTSYFEFLITRIFEMLSSEFEKCLLQTSFFSTFSRNIYHTYYNAWSKYFKFKHSLTLSKRLFGVWDISIKYSTFVIDSYNKIHDMIYYHNIIRTN